MASVAGLRRLRDTGAAAKLSAPYLPPTTVIEGRRRGNHTLVACSRRVLIAEYIPSLTKFGDADYRQGKTLV